MSNKMKKIDTKNWTHYFFADNINIKNFDPNNISPTCYYFDDMIRIKDFDLDNILIDEKPYENILAHTFWTRV